LDTPLTVAVGRAPVSRPHLPATGRPERPDPCADPPTVTMGPTRVLPAVTPRAAEPGTANAADPAGSTADTSAAAVTVPRLRSVTPAGGGALGDGRVLAAASVLGLVGSLVGWLVAARTLPAAEVGRAVAVVSVVAVAACAARPDRGAVLVARLPAAGREAGRVVVRSLAMALALGAAAGAVLALLVPGVAATASAGPAVAWSGVAVVAVAAAVWAVGAVHDGAVVALDRPWWATAHVGLLAAARVALLAAFAGAAGAGGVAAAWLLPVLLWAGPGSVAVVVLARRYARGDAVAPPQVLGPTAVARLGATLLHHVVPLLVVLGAGPRAGAVFFVAWQVVTAVDLAAVWVLGRAGAGRWRVLLTVGPGLAAVAVVAEPLLWMFGPDYAAAADVLRVLLLGAAFRLVVVHELAERETAGRAWASARLHLGTTVPTLLAVAAVAGPDPAGADTADTIAPALLPVAAGYALVQLACAAAVLVRAAAGRRKEGAA
jgi:hypothetical protein